VAKVLEEDDDDFEEFNQEGNIINLRIFQALIFISNNNKNNYFDIFDIQSSRK